MGRKRDGDAFLRRLNEMTKNASDDLDRRALGAATGALAEKYRREAEHAALVAAGKEVVDVAHFNNCATELGDPCNCGLDERRDAAIEALADAIRKAAP